VKEEKFDPDFIVPGVGSADAIFGGGMIGRKSIWQKSEAGDFSPMNSSGGRAE